MIHLAKAGVTDRRAQTANAFFLAGALILGLFACGVEAAPSFNPDSPDTELAPGSSLPIAISPGSSGITGMTERLDSASWTEGGGQINRTRTLSETGDSIDYQVPTGVPHCTALTDTLTVDWKTCSGFGNDVVCTDGNPVSTGIKATVVDPLTVSPSTGAIAGASGSLQTISLQLAGGRAPYKTPVSSSGASVSLSGSTLSYRIPTSATSDYSDTITLGGDPAGDACGGNSASISLQVSVTPSLTISPESTDLGEVAPGETLEATFRVSGGTPAYTSEILSGPPGATLSTPSPSDGSMVFRYAIPADAASGANSVTIRVQDSGQGESQQSATANLTFNLVAPPPPDTLTIQPQSRDLGVFQPGQTVQSSFIVSGGTPAYTATLTSGPEGARVTNSGQTLTFSYRVPANATPGANSASIQVRDSGTPQQVANATLTFAVAISGSPLSADPQAIPVNALSLVNVTNQVEETFQVSGGAPPYRLSVVGVSGGILGRVEPAELSLAGPATYIVDIPANAQSDLRFENRIQIIDSEGASLAVTVRANVTASNTLSTQPGLTPNQRSVARAVETVCPQLATTPERTADQEDLLEQCTDMLQNPRAPGIPNTLEQITNEKANASKSAAIETGTQQMANIGARLAALRSGSTGIDFGSLALNLDGQSLSGSQLAALAASGLSGGGASADGTFGRWGFFLNGTVNFGDRNATTNETGFDFSTTGITGGVDYRFSDNFVAGGAIGYAKNDVDFDSNDGGLDTETWHIAAYATHYLTERTYVDAILEYGWNDYDSKRNVAYQITSTLDPVSRQARASYSGNQFGASLGAGYDTNEGPLAYGVYGRLGYLKVDVDSFREKNAGGLNLMMDSFDATSVTTVLGARISRVINTDKAVLVPQARIEWEHEYDNDAAALRARFAADPSGTTFRVFTDDPDRDYFRIGLGLSAVFPRGVSGFVNYNTLIDKQDWTDHLIDAGVRWEFY